MVLRQDVDVHVDLTTARWVKPVSFQVAIFWGKTLERSKACLDGLGPFT